jgi:signal transduction histidine kinase
MTDSQVEHIFEPFFTSKRGQGGPGLGMTIVYNTVSKLQGHIQCTSEQGKGTTFIIELPAELQTLKR